MSDRDLANKGQTIQIVGKIKGQIRDKTNLKLGRN